MILVYGESLYKMGDIKEKMALRPQRKRRVENNQDKRKFHMNITGKT